MVNFKTKVLKHNNKMLNNLNLKQKEKTCNCRKKSPLDNNCLAKNIIYQATIKTNNITQFYVGLTIGIVIIRQTLISNYKDIILSYQTTYRI